VHRTYLALVRGQPGKELGVIDSPIGRHAKDRKRISTRTAKPRRAVTRWKIVRRLGTFTLLEVTPETGRTHQIRVHLASVGLPVAGDQVYGRWSGKTEGGSRNIGRIRLVLKRQALHAALLGFVHPSGGRSMEFESPLPNDINEAIQIALGEAQN
jgi:23S rRNA pseudouridine1911/1915/1917 synthase